MNLTWIPVAALFLVVACGLPAAGIAFRAGHMRSIGAWYFRKGLPFYFRNFPFAAIPSGLGSLLLFAVFPLTLVDALWAEFVGLGAVVLVLVCLVVAIGFMIWPPAGLKPRWIVERERAGRG